MIVARTIGQAACGLALLVCSVGTTFAAAFSVNPVRASLTADRLVAALTIRNRGTEPTVIQIDVAKWSQHDGTDTQTATDDLLATPPIFTVPAGGSQIVRVGLRRAIDPQRELTYRLLLREIPRVAAGAPAGQLKMALAISIPVFVAPVEARPRLQWRAALTSDGSIELSARNTGNAHVQVGRVELALAGGNEVIAAAEAARYLLPENAQVWSLTPAALPLSGTPLRVIAQTDGDPIDERVILEAATREGAADARQAARP